uniref:Uncharacterized protein n=1 Tax=Sphaerodactylus townsendi TaxID=933632 RepID=A0ACB8FNE8_9SAUR
MFLIYQATTFCMLDVPFLSFDSKNLVHPALELSLCRRTTNMWGLLKKIQSGDLLSEIKQDVEFLSNDMKAYTSEDLVLLCNFKNKHLLSPSCPPPCEPSMDVGTTLPPPFTHTM